ncbi:MAG: GntR family transcriptional regulator [Devosia sp.]
MAQSEQAKGMSAAGVRSTLIHEELRRRILTIRYPPEAVLREEELSREFAVSRTPIRRVLSKLEQEGLLLVKHGVGNIVAPIDPERLAEVYAVRMILAQNVGRFLRRPFPDDIVAHLCDCREAFKSLAPGDVGGFGETDIRYYMGLTDLIENRSLKDLMRELFFQTARLWLLSLPALPWHPTITAVADELDDLVGLIRSDDPEGLALMMRHHVFMARRRVFSGLDIGLREDGGLSI